jgi:hypothetical protein
VYGSDDDSIAATLSGRSSLTSNLNRRVSLSLSGEAFYSPYYGFAPSYGTRFQDVGSFGGGFGVSTAAERNVSTEGRAAVNVRLSRRDTFEAELNARHADFLDQQESSVAMRATDIHSPVRSGCTPAMDARKAATISRTPAT